MTRRIGLDRRLTTPSLGVAFTAALFVCLLAEESWAQQAENYPQRPIEYIVPWGPGGGADQLARKSGRLLESILGVSVPVLNVPGATGGSGLAKLLAAPADGYTMAVYIADSHALLATSAQKWRLSDLVPVARMISTPSYLFVAENSRFKSWSDFGNEAKARPGRLKVATLGYGSIDDITLTYLEGKGIKVIQVPFSNPGERYLSVLGGHADALYEQAGDVAQYIKNKQMRPIIVFAADRFPAFPDVPSSKELGYDIALPQFRTVVVKAGTDAKKIQRLSEAFKKVADSPEYKPFLREQYAFENSYMGAEETMTYIRSELDAMKSIFAMSRK